MFDKLVNMVTGHGIKVDTIIDDRSRNVMPGGVVSGTVRIDGDLSKVDGVTVSLVTHCVVEAGDDKVWGSFELASGSLPLNATGEIEFAIRVPHFAPLSINGSRNSHETYTELKTNVIVPWALDPADADRISIGPDPIQNAVFRALDHLGCKLKETECEYTISKGFTQEFDFTPPVGTFGIEEVEISFGSGDDRNRSVMVTVDNRGSFFAPGRERQRAATISRGHASSPAGAVAPVLMSIIQHLSRT